MHSGFRAHALDPHSRFLVHEDGGRTHLVSHFFMVGAVDRTGVLEFFIVYGSPTSTGPAWLKVGTRSYHFVLLASAVNKTALLFQDPVISTVVIEGNAVTAVVKGASTLTNFSDCVTLLLPSLVTRLKDLTSTSEKHIQVTLLCAGCRQSVALQRSVTYKEWHRKPSTRWQHGTVIIIDLASRSQGSVRDASRGLNNCDLVRVVTEFLPLRLKKLFPDYEVHVTRAVETSSFSCVHGVTSGNPLKLLLGTRPSLHPARWSDSFMESVFGLIDPAIPENIRSNGHVTGSPGSHSCNGGLNLIEAVSSRGFGGCVTPYICRPTVVYGPANSRCH